MREQLVTSSDKIYGGINRCTSITVHETANTKPGADAQAHADLQSSGNVRQASWQVQVDDKEAIRSYPDSAQCWHGGTREAAESSLAVEICVNADGDYDKAFRNAAKVVRAWRIRYGIPRHEVKQHFDWTGKDCPSQMRLTQRWEEFLDLTEPAANPATTKKENPVGMISPFQGRLTQHHGDRGGYAGHKGMDIAPPKPGQVGLPVYAAFAGTWQEIVRNAKPGNKTSTWAPGRTGNGGLISNPDGEGNGYNHMRPLDHFEVGDKVVAGQLIGYNDRSGNQTGPHLHFELWADWRNSDSDYAPELAFEKFDVKPGSAPERTSVAPAKPAASTTKPAGKYTGGSVVDYLVSVGQSASFANRKALASKHGITGYTGTADQNTALLNALRSGKAPAAKPAKSITQMAKEIIDGKHGAGHANRRKSLGISGAVYEKVRAEVNRLATGKAKPAKSISQMATEVIAGKHGTGHAARQKSLGVDAATYAKVRAEVNRRL